MYGSNNLIIFYYIIFLACAPCKLKLFTWSQVDSMIDMLCEGPEYNTKLKVITEDKDVEKLKERAARERARASRAAQNWIKVQVQVLEVEQNQKALRKQVQEFLVLVRDFF